MTSRTKVTRRSEITYAVGGSHLKLADAPLNDGMLISLRESGGHPHPDSLAEMRITKQDLNEFMRVVGEAAASAGWHGCSGAGSRGPDLSSL